MQFWDVAENVRD